MTSNPPLDFRLSIYHPYLRPLLSVNSLPALLQSHARLLTSNLLSHPFAISRLLRTSAAFAPLPHTLRIFISSFRSGFLPDSFTLNLLFAACARLGQINAGEMLHCIAIKLNLNDVINIGNSIVSMYAKCGLVGHARQVFDEMPERDVVSWNSIVDAYVKCGEVELARELFDKMGERSLVSWNVMIAGLVRARCPEMGLGVFREMTRAGVRGDEKTMVSVATACGRLGRVRDGMAAHSCFVRRGFGENVIFGTALVDMYCRCRRVELAERVFEGIERRNLVCWNAMILGHCVNGNPDAGLGLFRKMVGEDSGETDHGLGVSKLAALTPDEITFVGVLCGCARRGLLTEAKKYFNQMSELYNLKQTFAHHWCMANLYGRLGLIDEAIEVLWSLPEETESLVLGGLLGLCRFHGEVKMGENIARRLVELEPYNGSRYALLQSVYVAAGKWEEAYKVKETMKEKGIRPVPRHRLVHLNEIVHDFSVGDSTVPLIEQIYRMLDDLAERLRLGNATNFIDNEKV